MEGTGSPQYDALVQRLKNDLDWARGRYEHAKNELEQVRSLAQEIGLDTVDGAYSMQAATKRFRFALEEYSRALRRFCDLVVESKIPDD